jgi:hypothetical protein
MKIFIRNPIGDEWQFEHHKISHMGFKQFIFKKPNLINYLTSGIIYSSFFAKISNPHYMNRLFIEKDKGYFEYLYLFYEKYKDYDVIVINPPIDLVHPEFLYKHFKNSFKVLHFIDDPHRTYSDYLPYSWVFDAATYISPSYSEDIDMAQLLSLVGFKSTFWAPQAITNINPPKWTVAELEKQLKTRKKQAVYFGNFYLNKMDRLITLKKKLKNNFEIYGKFPLKGFSFFVYSLLKKKPVTYLPKSYSSGQERDKIYEKIAIGINMHLSHPAIETGNTRTYELPYNGVAQIVDISKVSLINKIFEPNKEILTYENIDECIYQTKRLIDDDDLRCKIALAGYKKAIKEYSYDKTLKNLISWFEELTH